MNTERVESEIYRIQVILHTLYKVSRQKTRRILDCINKMHLAYFFLLFVN